MQMYHKAKCAAPTAENARLNAACGHLSDNDASSEYFAENLATSPDGTDDLASVAGTLFFLGTPRVPPKSDQTEGLIWMHSIQQADDNKLYHPDTMLPLGDILHPDDLELFQPFLVNGTVHLTKSGRSTMQQENLLRLRKIWQNLDEIGLSRPLRKTAKSYIPGREGDALKSGGGGGLAGIRRALQEM